MNWLIKVVYWNYLEYLQYLQYLDPLQGLDPLTKVGPAAIWTRCNKSKQSTENSYFNLCWGIFENLWLNIKVFGQNNLIFELLQQKWCRIIMSFRQNTISGPETCQIGPKLWLPSCPDLPRPVQEDKYLLQTSGNAFIFSDFIKSSVLLNKFIIFHKIICFTKQIWHFYKIICFIK